MKAKSYIINLVALYEELTGSADMENVVDVVYLDFSKAFTSFSHNIFHLQADELWAR